MNITLRKLTENNEGVFEFDYIHPLTNKRVRRKIETEQEKAYRLKELLETIGNEKMDLDTAISYIRTNYTTYYYPEEFLRFLEEKIQTLYFHTTNSDEHTKAKYQLLHQYMPLDAYNTNICLLGRTGSGKSTIIKKISTFWGKDNEINFPFTDTSRTSTFPADYCFISETDTFKILVILASEETIELNISECIDRAVHKLIECRKESLPDTATINTDAPSKSINDSSICKIMDDVMTAFFTDPNQTFDVRYSIGRYIRTSSAAYEKPENNEIVNFWKVLFQKFIKISNQIIGEQYPSDTDVSFYQTKYSENINHPDQQNPIYAAYLEISDYIWERVHKNRKDLENELNDPDISNKEIQLSKDTPYFFCEIKATDTKSLYKVLKIFTTKNSSEFGRSFFNLVEHLRIELPLNPALNTALQEKFKNDMSLSEETKKGLLQKFSFVVQDTVGVAHSNDGNGGFQNSTELKMEHIDSVILLDDARANGDNNISALLLHVLSRVIPSKIYFAFTFFDDLMKEDFEEDEDLNTQRISYLIAIEQNTITNNVQDSEKQQLLLKKLNEKDSFFMSGLMEDKNLDSIVHLVSTLIIDKLQSSAKMQLHKTDPTKPFVSYDYKKLPLLYQQAITRYYHQQYSIYITDPPHYKTTEALTNRLSIGISYFAGARKLTPVDDLYNLLLQELSAYIDAPAQINLSHCESTMWNILYNELKSKLTDTLGDILLKKFRNYANEWRRLYCLSGTGSDKKRRLGILEAEKIIAPDIEAYLKESVNNHLINIIEQIFRETIQEIENKRNLNGTKL